MESLRELYAQALSQEAKDVICKLFCQVGSQQKVIDHLGAALREERNRVEMYKASWEEAQSKLELLTNELEQYTAPG